MTAYRRDRESLRDALAELRVADERAAPSFDVVVARHRARHIAARWRLARLAAVTAGIAIVAISVYRAAHRSDALLVPSEVIALSRWRPTTNVLLETPALRQLREPPRLDASLIVIRVMGESK